MTEAQAAAVTTLQDAIDRGKRARRLHAAIQEAEREARDRYHEAQATVVNATAALLRELGAAGLTDGGEPRL